MFVVIYEHEVTSAYLYLDERKCVEHTINLDYLERMEYERDYPNGYGGYLPCLKLFIKEGQKNCPLQRGRGQCLFVVEKQDWRNYEQGGLKLWEKNTF